MEAGIIITIDGKVIKNCGSVIIVPEEALQEHGFIRTMTVGEVAASKHEFHAMAQMAYYQYQDDEVDVVDVSGNIDISLRDQLESVSKGVVIYRDAGGEFHVLAHGGMNTKKLLEAANRYCTRWVRLDI